MAKYVFIFNPVAGAGRAVAAFDEVRAYFDERGADYVVYTSEYAGHAIELAKRALEEKHGNVVAVGGDGTLREIAGVLMHTDVPVGVIPCGTGNDFVRVLGIPKDDMRAAARILLEGTPEYVDMGEVNGEVFCNVGGIGFDVDVILETDRYKKRFQGVFPYLFGILRALLHMRLKDVVLTADDGVPRPARALMVEAGNGTHYGGGMHVTPYADARDGLLDVSFIHDVSKLKVLQILPSFLSGKYVENKKVTTYFKTKTLRIDSDPPSRINVDGEVVGSTPAFFTALPRALRVITEKNNQSALQ